MVFDKPVNKLDVYNGIVDKDAGQDFKVVSPKWSTKAADGGDSFSLKAEFPATSFPPQLEGLVVDGVYKTCRELKPTTNGARVATSQHVPWPSKVLGESTRCMSVPE